MTVADVKLPPLWETRKKFVQGAELSLLPELMWVRHLSEIRRVFYGEGALRLGAFQEGGISAGALSLSSGSQYWKQVGNAAFLPPPLSPKVPLCP